MSSQASGGLASYLPLIIIVAAFWLLVLRPQQQRAKAQRQMLSELEVGDRIVTIGGIYGTILEIREDRVLVEVVDGSQFELSRRAVGSVLPPDEDDQPVDLEDEPVMADSEVIDEAGTDAADENEGDK